MNLEARKATFIVESFMPRTSINMQAAIVCVVTTEACINVAAYRYKVRRSDLKRRLTRFNTLKHILYQWNHFE